MEGCRATSPREVEKVERSSWANFERERRRLEYEYGKYMCVLHEFSGLREMKRSDVEARRSKKF